MAYIAIGFPSPASFSPTIASSGFAIDGANPEAAKGNSINYSQMNRNHFKVNLPEKNKVRIFNLFPENR